ncbi:MAG: hypothetical protein GX455_17095 [Phycisphaerae bacterium]|nr:hypothetical protein [Phycisphaerae bacterium]
MATDWEIKKPLGQCSGTGTVFSPGTDYFAALVQTEQGLERRDYSISFWESEKPSTYCFWRSRIPEGREKKRLFVSDEMLVSFFERLSEETDVEKVNFRFVLTLILMRKRKLKYESSRTEEGREIWTLRVTGEDRSVQVVNPHLAEDQIEQLSSQMGQILQVEL